MTLATAGRVGRCHGTDGSFYVEDADHPLAPETEVLVGGERRRVVRRAGTEARPLIALSGLGERAAVAALRGEALLVEQELADDEWIADDLVGCEVDGLGAVRRVIAAPSCDVLELEDGRLVPFVGDAVRRVDLERRVIDVDRDFLGDLP